MANYAGKELELFKHARNWKKYYSGFFTGYIKGDVLEVGAGIGETTALLCDGSQRSWVCVEPDEQMANEIILKKAKGYLPSFIETKIGLLASMATHRRFDTIVYIDVIEHIENDVEELQRAVGFLKNPVGHLIILVPAHQYLYSAFDKAIGHFRRYNKKLLQQAVLKELRQVDLKYLDAFGLFASLGNKWFLKQDYPGLKQIKFWDNYIIPVSVFAYYLLFYSIGKTTTGNMAKVNNYTE